MSKEENQIIADFMCNRYVNHVGKNDRYKWQLVKDGSWYEEKDLQYDKSWDWLFPVLEKIEAIGYRWEIGMSAASPYHYCKIWSIGIIKGISPLDAIYGAVIEFIKWYTTKDIK